MQTMQASKLQPTQLLHYQSNHRVLICKECHYAIQPSAISRHLKDLHRIYRSHRQEFVEYARTLDLAEPRDVVLPEPHEAPVPLLPTENGQACDAGGCGHLCITVKRMKSHWAKVHGDISDASWRPVTLQTFFRGNQLRYFIVCERNMPVLQVERSSELENPPSTLEMVSFPNEFNWSTDDRALLWHFKSSTCLGIGYSPETRQLWQSMIPRLSCSFSFLKHGILGCSALHLAYLNPSERLRYQSTAARHQNKALPEFRAAIATADENNCNALLAFSQLLVIQCTATEVQDETACIGTNNNSSLTSWLRHARSTYTSLKTVWKFIESGPLAPLIPEGIDGEHITPAKHDLEHTRRLASLICVPFFGDNPLVKQVEDGALSPFPGALLELTKAFQKSRMAQSKSVFTLWTAISIWPARISSHYLDRVEDGDLTTLVVLAHYCILLKPVETHWYTYRFAQGLLSRIYYQLDENWRQWLEWPLEEIGLRT